MTADDQETEVTTQSLFVIQRLKINVSPLTSFPTCHCDTERKSGKDFAAAECDKHNTDEDQNHAVGRRNSPLTKSRAHDSFITSLTVSKVSTACLWSDNLHIEGVLEYLLSIKMLNEKWFL